MLVYIYFGILWILFSFCLQWLTEFMGLSSAAWIIFPSLNKQLRCFNTINICTSIKYFKSMSTVKGAYTPIGLKGGEKQETLPLQ